MEAVGRASAPRSLTFLRDSRDRVKPHILRWMDEGKKIKILVSFDAQIVSTASGGIIIMESDSAADVHMETWYKKRTLTQLATLKAIESLLYWAHNGTFPLSSTLLDGFHSVIMEAAGIMRMDDECGKYMRITTSSRLCTTADMNRFIEVAIQFVLDADIPHTMTMPALEMDFRKLYQEWYKIRSLEPDMDNITWEEYCVRYPYDEFNCISNTEGLQKMHIVSRGSDVTAIDESWNWIRGPESIHIRIQHQHGWGPVLQEFPHIIPKVERARQMAKKRSLI